MSVRILQVLGFASEPALADRLHALGHDGCVEHLTLSHDDVHRRRLRAQTDKGTDCLIALPREQRLGDGAVLVLEPERAVVVRLAEESWIEVVPRDAASALELGYFAGNLHWRVRFREDTLLIALAGPEKDYLDRLQHFVGDGRAQVVPHDD